jgi:DNA methylase
MSEGTILQITNGVAAWAAVHGDSREVVSIMDPEIFDAIVCDPPYHLTSASRGGSPRQNDPEKPFGRHNIGARGFMGKAWDGGDVALRPETWAAMLDACKPGAHLIAFGGTRTAHRIACAIEDGGWEIRDSIISFGLAWIYGSGFPKSKNLGGGIGTALKPSWEPIIVARKPFTGTTEGCFAQHGTAGLSIDACRVAHSGAADLAAHQAQVDAIKARGGSMENSWKNSSDLAGASDVNLAGRWPPNALFTHHPLCRFTGTKDVAANPTWDTPNRSTEPSAFTGARVSPVRHANGRNGEASADKRYNEQGSTDFAPLPGARRDDTETIDQWECVGGCPVRELSAQSGARPVSGAARSGRPSAAPCNSDFLNSLDGNGALTNDAGSASRYFPQFQHDPELDDIAPFLYMAKAARSERDLGLDHFRARSGGEMTDREDGTAALGSPRSGAGRKGGARNCHPTVKPVGLLRWLVRLVTPSGGVVLDPFMGSGSCGVASLLEGRRYVGIDLNDSDEEPYVSIARARLHHVEGLEFVPRESLRTADPPKQVAMFGFDGTQGGGS